MTKTVAGMKLEAWTRVREAEGAARLAAGLPPEADDELAEDSSSAEIDQADLDATHAQQDAAERAEQRRVDNETIAAEEARTTLKTTITAETLAALQAAVDDAEAAHEALDMAPLTDAEAEAEDDRLRAAVDAANSALKVAIAEFAASDEPREYTLRDEGGARETTTCRPSEVEAEAREWGEGGTYDGATETVHGTVRWSCELTSEKGSVDFSIDPDEPECEARKSGHAWATPHELLGGLQENPGVVGHGGGVISREVCLLCGCVRETDTWATGPGGEPVESVSCDGSNPHGIKLVAMGGDEAAIVAGGRAFLATDLDGEPELETAEDDAEFVDDEDGRWLVVETDGGSSWEYGPVEAE